MSVLTDRQRVELALPACLIFALSKLPGIFAPADPTRVERAEADVAALRENLRTATLEPFADLTPKKQQALLRRMERVAIDEEARDAVAEEAGRLLARLRSEGLYG